MGPRSQILKGGKTGPNIKICHQGAPLTSTSLVPSSCQEPLVSSLALAMGRNLIYAYLYCRGCFHSILQSPSFLLYTDLLRYILCRRRRLVHCRLVSNSSPWSNTVVEMNSWLQPVGLRSRWKTSYLSTENMQYLRKKWLFDWSTVWKNIFFPFFVYLL